MRACGAPTRAAAKRELNELAKWVGVWAAVANAVCAVAVAVAGAWCGMVCTIGGWCGRGRARVRDGERSCGKFSPEAYLSSSSLD